MICARDISGTACASAAAFEDFVHDIQHRRILDHAEIIVRTPYRDLTRTVRMMMPGAREDARLALQVPQYAIPTFATERHEWPEKMSFVSHRGTLPRLGSFER